jgi:3-methyladenine DNA glycosylase AlkD
MISQLSLIRKELRARSSAENARLLQRFFKTGKGEYAEGDKFIGVKVPDTRMVARRHLDLGHKEILILLRSPVHEERLAALLLLIAKFEKSGSSDKERIYRIYLKNTGYINNWDLVDLSAHRIVGAFLWDKPKGPLYDLARSKMLWERRIAVISTFDFIKRGEFVEALKIAEMLLTDEHDLIHKAVGWMLREVGKRDQAREERFLLKHARVMPRTMLRYAIERFSEPARQRYLALA